MFKLMLEFPNKRFQTVREFKRLADASWDAGELFALGYCTQVIGPNYRTIRHVESNDCKHRGDNG